jgi:flagellin
MSLNSINTNIGSYYAQSNIGKASSMASSSISRLSSGNRIVQAKDDVAAMSAGTSLRTNVTTLRMALINTSQGASLLQVADGALSQVTDILQRQKAIAVQAGSGSLTDSERGFLNQEFQNLTQEIDRLVGQTNFNGVELLNGKLSETTDVNDVTAIGDKATASITFSQNIFAASTLKLNGVNVVAGTNFTIGADIQATLDSLVSFLNSSTNTALSQATYSRQGNSLVINQRMGGTIGEAYIIDSDLADSTALSANGTATGARIGVVNAQHTNRLVQVVTGIAATSTTSADAVAAAATAGRLTAGTIKANNNTLAATVLYTATAADTLTTIVNGINANTATSGVTARIGGYSGNYSLIFERNFNFAANSVNETASALTVAFGAAPGAGVVTQALRTMNVSALDGGTNTGLGAGRTVGTGLIGNNILTGQSQTRASVTLSFPTIADADLLTAANFGTTRFVTFATTATAATAGGGAGTAGTTADGDAIKFGFVNSATTIDTEVQVGTTLEQTLDNLVSKINSYRAYGSGVYDFQQFEARREGTNVIVTKKDVGDVSQVVGGAFTAIALSGPTGSSVFGGSSAAGALDSGNTNGITTTGVTNQDFIGKISGFGATFSGTTNSVTLNVTVGNYTYSGVVANTNPTVNTTVRLTSQANPDGTSGGYFDIELSANNGQAVTSQADANVFAQRINAAFESITFSQRRTVSSYNGTAPIITNGVATGSLIGTSVNMQLSNFTDVQIDKIRVAAPEGSSKNGTIEFTVNGETYRSSAGVGSRLGANGVFYLTSTQNADRYIEFRTGSTAIEFETAAKAASFQTALQNAFGVGNGSAALNFQVGTTTSDTLQVAISNVSTSTLFGGKSLNVLTAAAAAEASDAIDGAIDRVTSARAEVGALQSRFDFAAANVESSIQNQDAARGVLLDTDIAAESTAFSQAQVKLQAGIAVLAQANLLPQNLLKLIG